MYILKSGKELEQWRTVLSLCVRAVTTSYKLAVEDKANQWSVCLLYPLHISLYFSFHHESEVKQITF